MTEAATMNTTRWVKPNHVPTAITGPKRSRHSSMAEVSDPNVSLPWRTTKICASDRNQLIEDQMSHTSIANMQASKNTAPGCGWDFDDAKPARMTAARIEPPAARASDARRKLSPTSERSRQACSPESGVTSARSAGSVANE